MFTGNTFENFAHIEKKNTWKEVATQKMCSHFFSNTNNVRDKNTSALVRPVLYKQTTLPGNVLLLTARSWLVVEL